MKKSTLLLLFLLLIILLMISKKLDKDFMKNCVKAGYSKEYCEVQK